MNNYNDIKMVAEGDSIRYALIKEGKNMLYVFGVNPSTATDEKADPTMRKVIRFADINGFCGFAMMNLYPLRSTDPYALPHNIDFKLHQKNLQKIKEIIGNNKNPVVVLAFGNPINATTYLKDCLKDIVDLLQPLNPKWKQIGEPTKLGNPRHPSRAAYSMGINDFDVYEYIKK
ncbi:DUF1643 domain-containing protein [Xylanibacter ruminicola]|jgi:serine/threonine protein phosphatase 1|uniref:DUF1643 domain-containing protein n=1 Tax=Xylanibacter ruminicola TaxID=839 RepID=A0A1M6XQ90_XYLRU|nr:DUF1643 domain-containing protein [Xylanibacter ruminicola]SHL08167.1 hypothetical protein SAMN05216463_12179 [Xylanibacter ruminicola]